MSRKHPCLKFSRLLLMGLLLTLLSLACGTLQIKPYEEVFDLQGKWGSGSSAEVEGQVRDGKYEMLVKSNSGLYLASAGQNFDNAIYEVEATQVDGPLNNGFGMLFRVDDSSDSFYVFEISGDGFVWIGWCQELCDQDAVALVGGDWFRSPAVKQGLQEKNHLRVIADGSLMTFFVNGVEVGRTSDSRLTEGDIAIMVETLGERGVRVVFDNFKVTPQ